MPRVSFNPYEAPSQDPVPDVQPGARGRCRQAAIAAWLASAYWALMTALIVTGLAMGAGSGTALILPAALIALYAYRGYQVFGGDVGAANGLLVLHLVGGAVAVFQLMGADGVLMTLTGVKVAIHVVGAITAFRVRG
jgi:hypothetical protein